MATTEHHRQAGALAPETGFSQAEPLGGRRQCCAHTWQRERAPGPLRSGAPVTAFTLGCCRLQKQPLGARPPCVLCAEQKGRWLCLHTWGIP